MQSKALQEVIKRILILVVKFYETPFASYDKNKISIKTCEVIKLIF